MNPTQRENVINFKSDKYILDLETRHGPTKELKTTIISFLKSKCQKLLLLKTPDPSVGAWKLLQVLKELSSQSTLSVPKEYLEAQNQTMLRWKDLSEVLTLSESNTKFKKLLICEFAQISHLEGTDGALIKTILEGLNVSLKRKVVLIISKKDMLSGYLGNIKCESCLYFSVPENKIVPVFEATPECLIERASCGDVCAVEELLGRGVSVNVTGPNENTALHEAAANGHKDVVLTLLRNEGDHLRNKTWDRPIHLAAENGHKDVVLVFLENDIDVNSEGLNKRTPLYYAARNGHKDVVLTLLRNKAAYFPNKFREIPLHAAAENGHKDIVSMLLENGSDVNTKGVKAITALHYAAQNGHTDIVLTLLKYGADHTLDGKKNTPLHLAAGKGFNDIVHIFVEHGVNVNVIGWFDTTALHDAARHGHTDVVRTLLKNGARHRPSDYSYTPLHLAALYGYTEIVTMLLENGVDVNTKGMNGLRALHRAAEYGHKEVVLILIDKGAEFHHKDIFGATALDLAREHEEIVKLLKSACSNSKH